MPLAGDESAIRKYAQEMESLKKKVCAAVVPNILLPQAQKEAQLLQLCPAHGVIVAIPLSGCSKEDAAMKPNEFLLLLLPLPRLCLSADRNCPPAAAVVLHAGMHSLILVPACCRLGCQTCPWWSMPSWSMRWSAQASTCAASLAPPPQIWLSASQIQSCRTCSRWAQPPHCSPAPLGVEPEATKHYQQMLGLAVGSQAPSRPCPVLSSSNMSSSLMCACRRQLPGALSGNSAAELLPHDAAGCPQLCKALYLQRHQ